MSQKDSLCFSAWILEQAMLVNSLVPKEEPIPERSGQSYIGAGRAAKDHDYLSKQPGIADLLILLLTL